MKIMQGFSLGAGIGICIIAAYLMIKGYVNYGIVALIIGVVAIAVSSRKKWDIKHIRYQYFHLIMSSWRKSNVAPTA